MPKGIYDHKKLGPVPAKNKIKNCIFCGKEVAVRAKNSRAVCLDWECQMKSWVGRKADD